MIHCYPNRTVCEVLDELRKCNETRNYAYMLSLVEEVQSLANKMEASLSDKGDVKSWTEERAKLKKEIRELEEKKKALQ